MVAHIRRQDETIAAALRRIAGLLVDEAIAAIDHPRKPVEKKVHEVRQACKRLRALLRLVRAGFADFDTVNATVRDLARSLSHMRDAQVMIETLDLLLVREKVALAGIDAGAIRIALRRAQAAAHDPGVALVAARMRLVLLRSEAAHWRLTGEEGAVILLGLAATCRKARRAMRETFAADGAAEASHEWRKHVKYHAQQLRLIEPVAPNALAARTHRLAKLGELLGLRHDLDMLVAAIDARPDRFGGVEAAGRLAHVAVRRALRLDKRTRKLGAALFEEKPGQLAAQWAACWRSWQAVERLTEAAA